jgi:hypothetical protein
MSRLFPLATQLPLWVRALFFIGISVVLKLSTVYPKRSQPAAAPGDLASTKSLWLAPKFCGSLLTDWHWCQARFLLTVLSSI